MNVWMRFPSGPIVYEFHLSYQIFYQIEKEKAWSARLLHTWDWTAIVLYDRNGIHGLSLQPIHFHTASFLKRVCTLVQDPGLKVGPMRVVKPATPKNGTKR